MIKEFADYFSLSVWDWMAVVVALCSLAVACLSLLIAKKTLASQQQTEKNTLPIINLQTQDVLLDRLYEELFNANISIKAIQIYLKDGYSLHFSKYFLQDILLDENLVHLELFYTNPSLYVDMNRLHRAVKEFNLLLDTANDAFLKYKDGDNSLDKFFNILLNNLHSLQMLWITCLAEMGNGGMGSRLVKIMQDYLDEKKRDEEFMVNLTNSPKSDYSNDMHYIELYDSYKKLSFVRILKGLSSGNPIDDDIFINSLVERMVVETYNKINHFTYYGMVKL